MFNLKHHDNDNDGLHNWYGTPPVRPNHMLVIATIIAVVVIFCVVLMGMHV